MVLLLLRFARLVWHSRPRLCFCFFTEFGVSGFPAVGDLGQELADVLDFGFGPGVDDAFSLPDINYLRSGDLAHGDMVSQRVRVNSELLCRLICRKPLHVRMIIGDRLEIGQAKSLNKYEKQIK